MHNELIYEPNTFDRDRWERSMFQVCDPPPKLSNWQDYFVRIKQGEDLFPEFLHHYEPVLNSIAQKHISRYGLDDHFADVKMVYVETLLVELEHYDPASGVNYLTSIKRKLDAALHAYTMVNLKGFSETSETYYYQLRKAAYICHSRPEEDAIAEVCAQLNITGKTAVQLLEQVYAIDTFQWYGGAETEDGQDDIPMGIDLLGHCRKPQPEPALFHKETVTILHRAFWKLEYKEQDIVSRHLGFYKTCFRPLFENTFEELADLYQYTTADGVMRFYHRTLDKLRLLLEKEGMFQTVRLKRKKKTARQLAYTYAPSDEGEPGMIEFTIVNGIVQQDYHITKVENDYRDLRLGHASARLLLKLAQQDALPADRVFPLQNVHISK